MMALPPPPLALPPQHLFDSQSSAHGLHGARPVDMVATPLTCLSGSGESNYYCFSQLTGKTYGNLMTDL